MPVLLPALDLAAFLIFAVILVLALTVQKWLRAVFEVVDKVIGWAPFVGHWIKSGENHVLSALNAIVVSSRGAMATLLDGLRWSLREFETGVRDFADVVGDHWQQLVAVALPTALSALWSDLYTRGTSLGNRIDTLAERIAAVGPAIRKAADDAEQLAIAKATGYADAAIAGLRSWTVDHVRGVYREVEDDIATAQAAAERYADEAVATLRHAEDAAIAAATGAAVAALEAARRDLTAAIATVSSALTATRDALERELATVQAAASQALSAATTTIESELAQRAAAAAAALTATASQLAGRITSAEQAAEQAAGSALTAEAHTLEGTIADARTAAGAALTAATATIEGELAQRAADAQAALSAAEQTLESEVGAVANTAAAELHAAAAALEGTIGQVSHAAQAIAAELAGAEAAATGELTDIYNLPADALRDLLDRLDLTKVASFGAGLVLVRALVSAIAREAGLDSAECRAKNKQICGTPGGEWGDLLAGAAFVTGAISLAELVPIGRAAVGALAGTIRQAA